MGGRLDAERRQAARPVGAVTRGTTAPQRLRRVDRWLVGTRAETLRAAVDPLVVDLGWGARPVTTVELHDRLRRVRADVEVVGLEIDAERVAAAQAHARPGLSFAQGGFELGGLRDRRPVVVRAMNVLRQYAEEDVASAWARLSTRLAPGGLLLEGTCDEVGRRATWVVVAHDGPQLLVLSARLANLQQPGELAQRLPKALVHRNVEGEGVHALLRAWDAAWAQAAPVAPWGPRVRAVEAAGRLVAAGWPVRGDPRRWRLGELEVPWSAVAPITG